MTRQTKTPQQRAEEALGVAQRLVARLRAQREKHQAAIKQLDAEIEAAVTRLDYLAVNPDLLPEPVE